MRTVVPCFMSFEYTGQVAPVYDSIDILPLVALLFSQIAMNKAVLTMMPEFTPNALMLEKHAEKADEPW